MTDTEMLILCREAMGYTIGAALFNPLRSDEDAMALLKELELDVHRHEGVEWTCENRLSKHPAPWCCTQDKDLNRAIVKCVAKMQASTKL